eukprot:scaffold1461_cov253-Pinguiococcus_pyrenoidosus.AAC.30
MASNQPPPAQLWKPHHQVLQDTQVVMTSIDVDEIEEAIRVAQGALGREVLAESHFCSKPTCLLDGLTQESLLLYARDICAVDVVRLLPPEVDQDIKLRTMPLFQHSCGEVAALHAHFHACLVSPSLQDLAELFSRQFFRKPLDMRVVKAVGRAIRRRRRSPQPLPQVNDSMAPLLSLFKSLLIHNASQEAPGSVCTPARPPERRLEASCPSDEQNG